jgi:hypothetical protein
MRVNPDPGPAERSASKSLYVYGTLVVVIAAYVAYILISRHNANRALDRRYREKAAEQQRSSDRAAIEQLGGSALSIRALYVSPPVIHRGESAKLCYDVNNAKAVSLDPPEGNVWPSHTRCLNLSPKKTTTYTLTIADARGKSVSQAVELKVQ